MVLQYLYFYCNHRDSLSLLSMASLITKARKRTFQDADLTLSEQDIVNEAPTTRASEQLKSGRELMDVCGEATSIAKKFLPNNCLYLITDLKTVDISGTDQAVYMTTKAVMQSVPLHVDHEEEEEDLTEPDVADAPTSQRDTRITTENFEDVFGEPINDIIQCTAPEKVARVGLAGSVMIQTLDESLCFLVNESFDRQHPANLFMENMRLSYQFYSVSDLSKEVMVEIQDGDTTADALLEFFQSCLTLSKQYRT